MVKAVPVLGTLVLLGAIFQVVLGFQVAEQMRSLRDFHMLIGLVGLILVVVLLVTVFRSKTATIYSKSLMTILTFVVLVQVVMGIQLLSDTEALALFHQANGFVIVILSLLMGGVTFQSARRQVKA